MGNNDAIVAVELLKVREDKLCFAWLQNTHATLGIFSETKS